MISALTYFNETVQLLQQIRDTQLDNIEQAAEICAERIANGGLVFLFGAGHSRMMCEEMTPRQGCFVGFYPLVELALSNHAATIGMNGLRGPLFLEKVEGYADEILNSFKFGPHDAFIIISTSGIRPVIVEMARGVKERGMPVIAMLSRRHCENAKPGHSSGKKLLDYADVVLDNQCPQGDCIVEIDGLEWRTGPTSTVTGAMIMNMLRCTVAEKLVARGVKVEMLPSHHFIGNTSAEEQLERYYEAFRRSTAHLYV
ncbi:MAG: SIS domain-containing protein [Caldilineaceae bacterium]|nr:SIS domain-containing protein [Caldilineaceae bacterium]